MTLNDELTVIDETISELEGRRTEIINRMAVTLQVTGTGGSKVIPFPSKPRVTVRKYTGSAGHIW